MSDPQKKSQSRPWLTVGSIGGLTLGILLGAWANAADHRSALDIIASLRPIGVIWSNALKMVVLPLVVAQLLYCLVASRLSGFAGRISVHSLLVFTLMLVITSAVTMAAMGPLLSQIHFSPAAMDALRSAVPDTARPPATTGTSFATWITGLVPSNALRAAAEDNLVGVLIFTFAFGFAAARLPAERSRLIAELSRAVAEATMTIVGWTLWVMPLAVFVLGASTAARGGFGTIEVVATFIVLVCVVMLVWTLLLYPIASILGGVSMRRFARAMLPVQLVAVSTRSSIASLPSLLDSAEHRLGLRPDVASVTLPLAVSTFKLNYPITGPVQFMFLAHVYGIELSAMQLLTFASGILILSYSSIGIPNGGSLMRAAPFYLAAGIPIEGYLLIEAVEAIPDVFKTLINVTGDMTAATVVNRRAGQVAPAEAGARLANDVTARA